MIKNLCFCFFICIFIQSCDSDSGISIHNFPSDTIPWQVSDQGVSYYIVDSGDGNTLKQYEEIEVEYTGWYEDKLKFASSEDRLKPYKFKFGAGVVVKGWDLTLNKINKGGKIFLKVPPRLGFSPGTRGVQTSRMLIFGIKIKN